VDCESIAHASVDTATHEVSGCKQRLYVKEDTILIAFRAAASGLKTFPEITILTKDEDRIFRTMKYTFEYKVVEN
jgi:hypothetical protein